jgi:VanZ family protein
MRKFILTILIVAVVVTLYFALYPKPPQLLRSDKSQHELAFAVLTVLSCLAMPTARYRTIFFALATFGGVIEILQMIPALHRDADVMDWIADMAAIAIALAAVALGGAAFTRNRRIG